jgi:DNA-binding MarR family transcriptional regulator
MTKHELLQHLADAGQAYAMDIANTFGITYPAAAMALLRLARQGLVHRYVNTNDGLYYCDLSDRGHARLKFFQTHSESDGGRE